MTNTKFRNYTPHEIVLNDGRSFPSEGVARVSATFTDFSPSLLCSQVFGDVKGLPPLEKGVKIIVSAMVLNASDRPDLVAPATGHPDAKRNEKGHIISVPGFVTR